MAWVLLIPWDAVTYLPPMDPLATSTPAWAAWATFALLCGLSVGVLALLYPLLASGRPDWTEEVRCLPCSNLQRAARVVLRFDAHGVRVAACSLRTLPEFRCCRSECLRPDEAPPDAWGARVDLR